MEPSLPNGVVVDNHNETYSFYYKLLDDNATRKNKRKNRRYKCSLTVAVYSSKHLHIHLFDCKGRGKGGGEGKFLLCTAIDFLQKKYALTDSTKVSLTAMSHAKTNQRESQDKLIQYFNKHYGFEATGEKQMMNMFSTDMSTTINIVLDKCKMEPEKTTQPDKSGKRSVWSKIFSFI
jgi:hypothetical protein